VIHCHIPCSSFVSLARDAHKRIPVRHPFSSFLPSAFNLIGGRSTSPEKSLRKSCCSHLFHVSSSFYFRLTYYQYLIQFLHQSGGGGRDIRKCIRVGYDNRSRDVISRLQDLILVKLQDNFSLLDCISAGLFRIEIFSFS